MLRCHHDHAAQREGALQAQAAGEDEGDQGAARGAQAASTGGRAQDRREDHKGAGGRFRRRAGQGVQELGGPRSVTADTGLLIGVERGKARARKALALSFDREMRIVVPAIVLAEWWTGHPKQVPILEAVEIEPMTGKLAKLAALARMTVKGSTINDAIVMASSALRGPGDVVYTSDFDDLSRLKEGFFPAVTVLGV
jgi:hypothetical protein